MSFEILIHITFHNDPFYLHRGLVILSSSSILQHSEHFSVFCYPSRGWHSVVTSVQQLQGIFTVSHVRHIIALISYSGSFPGHISARGMFGLVGTLDSRFMVAGRWL